MLIAFSVAPTASASPDGSVSAAVAAAVQVVKDSRLPYRLGSMFTEIEGEWEELMDVVRRACEAAGADAGRVSLVLKADIRPGAEPGQLDSKIARVQEKLA